MAIIKHLDKKYGVVYVYESVSYWDKEKKQPRSKRKLIGKIDPVTGEIVPTGKRGRAPSAVTDSPADPPSSDPGTSASDEKTAGYALQPEPETQDRSAPIQSEDYQSLYLQCRRRLLETEAALAKANSTVSMLEAQKDEVLKELDQLAKKLRS